MPVKQCDIDHWYPSEGVIFIIHSATRIIGTLVDLWLLFS